MRPVLCVPPAIRETCPCLYLSLPLMILGAECPVCFPEEIRKILATEGTEFTEE